MASVEWQPPSVPFVHGGKNYSLNAACWSPGYYVNWTMDPGLGFRADCLPCPAQHYCPPLNVTAARAFDNAALAPVLCPAGSFCWSVAQDHRLCSHKRDFTYAYRNSLCPEGTKENPSSIEGTTRNLMLIAGTLVMYGLLRLMRFLCSIIRRKQYNKWKEDQMRKMLGETSQHRDVSFPARPGITFTYKNLSLTVKAGGKSKMVVDNVSGEVPAATMTAVMGPSGAGKTSFMNVLCDRAGYGVTTGTLTLNGKVDRISNHRDIMGFVPQDDVVHDDLTVRENLLYAAMLRLPIPDKGEGGGLSGCRSCSIIYKEQRRYYNQYVDRVLGMLQLGHIQDSIVGSVEKRGISGGQKKRVNIGLELVADPDVLFLDEPTSGLDSTSAEIILAALKELSRLGRTIIMVIHQPRYSIFSSMDNVIFLGPGGKTVYSGNPIDATDYFEMLGFHAPGGVNRADYFMDVIGGTVSRANFPEFDPVKLFGLWKDWVKYSNKPYFFNNEEKSDDGGVQGYHIDKNETTYNPRDILTVRKLWLQVVGVDTKSADALTSDSDATFKDITSQTQVDAFLNLVSEASIQGKLKTKQCLALCLVVRHTFQGNSQHFEIAADTVKMKRAMSFNRDGDNRQSQSSSPDEIELTIQAAEKEDHTFETVDTDDEEDDDQNNNVLKTAENKSIKNELQKQKADIERKIAREEVIENATKHSGTLSWNELRFTLALPKVMRNLLLIHSLENIGFDVKKHASESATINHLTQSTGLDDSKRRKSNKSQSRRVQDALSSRLFGRDHKLVQLGLFISRYLQKRYRSKMNWFMDLFILVLGAAIMGSIVGPLKRGDQLYNGGKQGLNHLMICLVFGTLSTIGSLNTFAANKLIFWRESSQDASIFAVWLSRNSVDLLFICFQTLVFTGVVYDMTTPLMSMSNFWWIYFSIAICNSGLGYLLSTFIPARNLTLYAALLVMLIGAFFSGTMPYLSELRTDLLKGDGVFKSNVQLSIASVSYSRWAVETLLITEMNLAPAGRNDIYGMATVIETGFGGLAYNANHTVVNASNPWMNQKAGHLAPSRRMLAGLRAGQGENTGKKCGTGLDCTVDWNVRILFMIGIVLRCLSLLGLYLADRTKMNKSTVTALIKKCLCQCNGISNLLSAPSKLLEESNLNDELDVDWEERVSGHGLSQRTRQARNTGRMAMLFDIWDVSGDGVIDNEEMKGLVRAYLDKLYVVFGDENSWSRIDNLGFVTQQTFQQFFDWFVMEPTIEAIMNGVEHGFTEGHAIVPPPTTTSENTEETKDASVRRQSFIKKPSLSSNISPSKIILPRTAQEEADKQSIRRMKSVGTLNQGLNAARRRRKRRSIAGGHFPHPPPEEKPKFN